ncbi:MAG: SDR family NAD(P)-dependent oxidoreductase [Verrucomicrobiota bacterium]
MDFESLRQFFSRYSAVVITGESSGIGAGMLNRLLELIPSTLLINVSRSCPEGFGESSNRLHFACNLLHSEAIQVAHGKILEALQGAPNGPILFINNSGVGYVGKFHQLSLEQHLTVIDLNIRGTVNLTMRLLPELVKRGGDILTIASTSAFQPTPRFTTYGASKSFLMHWSLAMSEDLRGTDVHTLVVCPGPTRTPFIHAAGINEDAPLPSGFQTVDEVVFSSLRALKKRKRLHTPGFWNRILAGISAPAPKWLSTRVAARIMDRSAYAATAI